MAAARAVPTLPRMSLLLAVLALASDPQPKVVREPDKVVVRKKTVIDFNDVTVEGELTRPEAATS